VPAGPRIAVNLQGVGPERGGEVRTVDPDGGASLRIAGGSAFAAILPLADTRPSWNFAGNRLAFLGPAQGGVGTYLVGAAGTPLQLLQSSIDPGGGRTFVQDPPVFSPDGSLIANVYKLLSGHFERAPARFNPRGRPVVATALWSIPTDGSVPSPLGPFQQGRIASPDAVLPDGSVLAQVSEGAKGRVVTLGAKGVPVHTVATEGPELTADPALSPDGSLVAYMRQERRRSGRGEERIVASDLMVVPVAGGKPRRIVRIKGGARWPAWDPSGSRLSYTTLDGGGINPSEPNLGNALMEINADGTCPTEILGEGETLIYGAAWQPGEGRGAGPISC
jgi:Tol biopolymer transport system component